MKSRNQNTKQFNLTTITRVLSFATAVLALSACANSGHSHLSQTEKSDGRDVTRAAAVVTKAKRFAEVQFDPGSATLSDSSKATLRDALLEPSTDSRVQQVILLAWSDEELPSKAQKKLPKAQIELADRRNQEVENYLKSFRQTNVEKHNMAKREGLFAQWFDTQDNQLKKSLLAAGLPTTASENQYPSKASHAIVLIKVD